MHHDKLDEALRKLAALYTGLNFSYGSLLVRGCGAIWWSHRRKNVRLIAKIFRSHALNVVERDCFDVVLKRLVVIEPKSVELIQRALITERIVALVRDFLLPDQFLFRACQFFIRKTITGEFPDLIEQCGFHWLD